LLAVLRQQVDQPHQRDLRRVSLTLEHRLAGEESADRDAIQAADQAAFVPGLDAVCPAKLEQAKVSHLDRIIDPLPWAIGAGIHHLCESGVDRGRITPNRLPERASEPKRI